MVIQLTLTLLRNNSMLPSQVDAAATKLDSTHGVGLLSEELITSFQGFISMADGLQNV
jgi:hypothetical protein